MKSLNKKILFALALLIGAYTASYYVTLPHYEYQQPGPLPSTFDLFYKSRLSESIAKHARPGNEEKLVRYSPGKTPLAILYIHGYGASRAEGEYSVDRIASALKANTYYLRLPGHGTNNEDHRDTDYPEYLKVSEDSFLMMNQLGEKVVIVGTSMGGLIATYLASKYPDKIAGIVLLSPFYDYAPVAAKLFYLPGGKWIAALVNGKIRKSKPIGPGERLKEHYYEYWYKDQYLSALEHISDLRKLIAKDEVFEKVTCPTLLEYYYKDEKEQDVTASVPAMLEAYSKFGGKNPSPLNRKVAISDGNHVLASMHVETDKKLVESAAIEFLKQIMKK
ncbi:hypothetical protein CH373_05455 [Leptospira perolatii]|uniref:AB hydrolase-1 domain-containing protein n=1 Tax=Leptospira perolatii TaxID=2023191 RepID=A0A2M9ZQK1_9LEPT|nr:alpha/beta hydrolase [Leptospira perolatii]PJZ70516.1 hypothetical protein CH360_05875 [Leptospira perolatii]PJZ74352.1 hypothetical protein CH373_05455 [Leptospira perolatii]